MNIFEQFESNEIPEIGNPNKVKFEETIPLAYQVVRSENKNSFICKTTLARDIVDTYEIRFHGELAKVKAIKKAEMMGHCRVIELCENKIEHEILVVGSPTIVDRTELHKSGHKRYRVVLRRY